MDEASEIEEDLSHFENEEHALVELVKNLKSTDMQTNMSALRSTYFKLTNIGLFPWCFLLLTDLREENEGIYNICFFRRTPNIV